MTLLLAGSGDAQEAHSKQKHAAEHDFHRNHFGGLVGVSARLDTQSTGAPTIGLDYARQFSRHWAAVGYVELVSSTLERDFILALGAAYYPIDRLGLVVGLGGEKAEKQVVEHGHVEKETEWEVIYRAGIGYGFPLTETAALGPSVLIDQAGDRTTMVIGLAMVVGF
jgi:hypothetical protein